jgi:ferredoxin
MNTNAAQVAFYLTGQAARSGLDPVDALALRPALLAGYRDLTTLRYDFPLVLVEANDPGGRAPRDGRETTEVLRSLSGLVDDVLRQIAHGEDGERVSRHVLRLERQVRALVAHSGAGGLAALWDEAAARLTVDADAALQNSLDRAKAVLAVDGLVVDCGEDLSARVVTHAWRALQTRKAARRGAEAGRLAHRLSDILRADLAHSEAGRRPASLRAALGSPHEDAFDVDVMSRVLTASAPASTLPAARRRRIRDTIAALEATSLDPPSAFAFTRCSDALAAWRERLPHVMRFATALTVAELEVNGEYQERVHDGWFGETGVDTLDPELRALLPDYLVCLNAADLDPEEQAALMELLMADLPMKVLVQWDDLVDESSSGDEPLGVGARSRQLAHMAMGAHTVYVLQAAASHLVQCRDRLTAGLAYPGPALFSVYSGAAGSHRDLPPYLAAAAAMESRVFPALVYDPSAGSDWASRFSIDRNPQADADWPRQRLAYEDAAHQRVAEDVAFTAIDFLACDRRYARHLARAPRAAGADRLVPASEGLGRPNAGRVEGTPYVLMVDRADRLHTVLVDEQIVRDAGRIRDAWRSLQELGGIHNSHAARVLARDRKEREEREAAPAPPPEATVSATPSPAPPEAVVSPDEPCIETPRCTTCNECTRINPNMFAYNENKQAYIKNPGAGTYAQLVEAAESCQVSIIHPGKPKDPNEPGLDELVTRAQAFQ